MFRISDDKTYDYNVNAVIQLIDSTNCIFRLIRNEDKNYVVKLNTDDMDRLIKVRNYYANGDGQYNFWSRSIIDLVETEFGLDERRTNINHEKNMSKHNQALGTIGFFLCLAEQPRVFNCLLQIFHF